MAYTDKGTIQRYLAVDIESDYDSLITTCDETFPPFIASLKMFATSFVAVNVISSGTVAE